MDKDKFLIFNRIFWMVVAVIFLVYLDKIYQRLGGMSDLRYSIDEIGKISNYSRQIKDPDNPYGYKYEKVPLEIIIVKW